MLAPLQNTAAVSITPALSSSGFSIGLATRSSAIATASTITSILQPKSCLSKMWDFVIKCFKCLCCSFCCSASVRQQEPSIAVTRVLDDLRNHLHRTLNEHDIPALADGQISAQTDQQIIMAYKNAKRDLLSNAATVNEAKNALEQAIQGENAICSLGQRNRMFLNALVNSVCVCQSHFPQYAPLIDTPIQAIANFSRGYTPPQDSADRRIGLVAALQARTSYAATLAEAQEALWIRYCGLVVQSPPSSDQREINSYQSAKELLRTDATHIANALRRLEQATEGERNKILLNLNVYQNLIAQDAIPSLDNSIVEGNIELIRSFDEGYAPGQNERGQMEDQRTILVEALRTRATHAAAFVQAKIDLWRIYCEPILSQ